MSSTKNETLFWGTLILILGILFLIKNVGVEINVWHLIGKFWPLILIYIGLKNIYLLMSRKK